jgi:FAD/FMN-containing dehydrogenase
MPRITWARYDRRIGEPPVPLARTLSGPIVALHPPVIDAFAGRLAGRVLVERCGEYDEARRVWNGLIDKRPAGIVQCAGVADVLETLRFARDHDLLLAVRGGGHNVAGFGTCDGGLVIDLSPLRGIRVDPAKRTVRAQAGVTWGDLDRETQAFGLAVPGGVVSTTGIAGLTLGGGQGWLRRTYGMTCDSLLSADVITSGGEFVTASDTERADLFWALRGGGGNFGIVTDFEYRLHPVGPVVTHATAMYPVEAAGDVLHGFRDYVETAPDAVNASATFWTVPGMPLFPERIHGRSVIAVTGIYVGDGQRGQQVLDALGTLGDPLLEVSEPRAYTSVQQMFDVFFPKYALRYYWKGLYLDSLCDSEISRLAAAFTRKVSPRSMLVVWAQGGALARVGPGDTAVGSRTSPFLLEILANWKEPEHTDANIAWARGVFDDMQQCSHSKPNFNFPGVEDDMTSFVSAAFGDQYERLVGIKHKYDPANVFRVNQNIT